MGDRESAAGRVIHVQFGPGGGRRGQAGDAPSSPTDAGPEAVESGGTSAQPSRGSRDPSAPLQPAAETETRPRARFKPQRDLSSGTYTRAEVAKLFGVPESRLRYWERTGVVRPTGDFDERRIYTFQDLIGVRTAKMLTERGIPIRRVRETVEALHRTLPDVSRPLSELRVLADGAKVVVRDEDSLFEPSTGQLVIDFDRPASVENVRILRPGQVDPARKRASYEAYLEGCRLDEDPATLDRAEAAYRRAIQLDPRLGNALTNLGNLRFRRGDAAEAESLYLRALELDEDQPEAHYNLGFIAYEQDRIAEAIERFMIALESDPAFADAHFNLALALEKQDRHREAREHWLSYLELEPAGAWAKVAKARIEKRF